jgi:hypothetical protein
MTRTSIVATSALAALACALAAPARAEVHVGIQITPPTYVYETPPRLVVVPGHPHVHYAPDVSVNFFSYGGRYYTYDAGNWFVASGNRGPWAYVERQHVPAYVLNVPTRYYHVAPHGGGGHSHGKGHKKGRGKGHRHHDHR